MQHRDHIKRLTVDWENVIKDQVAGSKGVSTVHHLTYESFIEHYGHAEFETEPTQYCTGSIYEGSSSKLGFSGFGQYTYPHGVIYTGFFKNGQFHGEGDLIYPKGHHLQGIWEKGKLMHSQFIFPDGLDYDHPWKYCKFPNRFYHGEQLQRGSACRDKFGHIQLKKNEYFTGDGIFDADTKRVRTIDHKILRVVSSKEEAIIKKEYKRGGDHIVGLNRQLYEHWITGRQSEVSNLLSIENAFTPDIEQSDSSINSEVLSEFTLVEY